MEFMQLIAEQAKIIEQKRLTEGVKQTLAEAIEGTVKAILEAEGSEDRKLAEAACKVMMKDKIEEVEGKNKQKKKPSLKETMDPVRTAEVATLAALKAETIKATYVHITEMYDSAVAITTTGFVLDLFRKHVETETSSEEAVA